MIKPFCSMCKKELDDFGALVFSPPKKTMSKKHHLCKGCYNKVIKCFK